MDRDEEGIAIRRWMTVAFGLIILGFIVGLSKIQDLQEGVPADRYGRSMEHLHIAYVFILAGTGIACYVGFSELFKRATFSFLPDSFGTFAKEIKNTLAPIEHKSSDPVPLNPLQSIRDRWDSIPFGVRLAMLAVFDASLGLRYQLSIFASLIYGDPLWMINFFEFVLFSMYILYWLLNTLQGWIRTAALFSSPIAILLIFAFCLDQLFIGQETTISPTFRLSSVVWSGFYWAAAYLAIAVGLTLTYKVQRFGNFAQAETMLFGAYVGFTMMWSPFFYTLVEGEKVLNIDVKKDDVLTWDLLFWACVTAFVLTGLLGVLIDRLVYSRFRKKKAIPQVMMIASLGVAMILRGLLYIRYQADQYLFVPDVDWRLSTSRLEFSEDSVPSPFGIKLWPGWMNQTMRLRFGERTAENGYDDMDQTACIEAGKPDDFSSSWDASTGLCNVTEYLPFREMTDSTYYLQYTKAALIIGVFAAVILLLLMLNMTRLGRQMRAVADNPDLAASSGINVERVHMTSAFLAAGISGFGGVLFGMYVRVNPNVGLTILLPAFSVIVLGTLGSIRGALFASVIIGMVRAISAPVLISAGSELDRPSYAAFEEAMPYLFLIGVLMLMPKGLGEALENWQIERARNNKGQLLSLKNLSYLILLILSIVKFGLFGFILWGILLFFFFLFSHSNVSFPIGSSVRLPSIPELPYVSDQFRGFSTSQRVLVFGAAAFQLTVVSILDSRISGIGTVYYLLDFSFIILSLLGLAVLYSSIATSIPDFNKIYGSATGLSYEQKKQLLGSSLLGFAFVYLVDYLVSGVGTIYLFMDLVFTLLQAFFFILFVITIFFLRSEFFSLSAKEKALPEVQKWGILFGGILFTVFVYYLDTVTSGSGVIYYLIDALYLVFLFLGIVVILTTIANSRAEFSHRLNLMFVAVAGLLLYFEDVIEPGLVRDTESKMYVKEIAYLFLVISINDLPRLIFGSLSSLTELINTIFKNLKDQVLTYVTPSFLILGFVLYSYVPHDRVGFDHFMWLGIFLMLYSINPLTENISKAFEIIQRNLWSAIMPASKAQYGRSSERGSWLTFAFFLIILAYLAWLLPSVTNFTKSMQISRIIILVCIFSILAFSLNLHTGMTGMTNFGVIFFAGIGAITLGILTVPEDRPGGHGWSPFFGLIAAVIVSGVAGWLLAYPTARLRMDYFAIVTISLGEIVRISMRAEPLLRAGTGTTAIGIQLYKLPLKDWWESTMDKSVGEWFNLTDCKLSPSECIGAEPVAAPYYVLLAGIALVSFLLIWALIELMLNSPWGRILRAIREDEEVTMHHGHDVFRHKATSLAVGAAFAGFGGALWAWLNMSILDDFINPVKTTFLIWAAFIVGGRANNRGMVIGAFIIVLTEFVFNLMVTGRGDIDNAFHDNVAGIDAFFYWFLLDVVGSFNSDLSILEPFGSYDRIELQLVYLKLVLIGLVITVSLLISERGLIPEVPKRPENPILQSAQDSSTIDFKGRQK